MNLRRHTSRTSTATVLCGALLMLLSFAASAQAAAPEWKLTITPNADYFHPGNTSLRDVYLIEAENVGGAAAESLVTLEDTLPPGVTAAAVHFYDSTDDGIAQHESKLGFCPSFTECRFPAESQPLLPGEKLVMMLHVAAEAAAPTGPIVNRAKVRGGGALTVKATATNRIDPSPPFGFHSFAAPLTDPAGQPYFQAGGHPYQLVTEMNFATESNLSECTGAGVFCDSQTPVRDAKTIRAELPPGLIGNPGAVPRCSLADFYAQECPLSTAIGDVGVRFEGQPFGGFRELGPLYNLISSGRIPGALGFQSAFALIFTASVRSGSDYGLSITSAGTPMAAINRTRVTTWGVPAEAAHDLLRGKTCLAPETIEGEGAPFANTQTPEDFERECEHKVGEGGTTGGPTEVQHPHPYLTLPTECSDAKASFGARFDTWQLPPSQEASAAYPEHPIDGCNQLHFEPEIEAHPTTNLADAPSGLDFKLTVPQNEACTASPTVSCESATPELREATVALPAGLSVNPSSANGLEGCSPEQIGLTTEVGATPAHFTETPNQCPAAAKIGSVEVHTSLLNEPLGGAVYLATPRQNPFGSLLAAYIVLEGQGLIFKLPGRIELDHETGQITGSFLENPQLPFEDFELRFFGGAQGDLRTPSTCGEYKTTSVLTPYSAPESGPSAEPESSFETKAAAHAGESCPTAASQQPNAPVFRAGTESPQAAAFSPFSFRLARADGSQEISKIETSLPPGLSGKLAGIAECSDAQLAVATSREHEGGGGEELASPSCPSSSEVGTVEVAAGAGPTPLYTQGKAYLAGPYKGAPLSLAIITPAVAGPFDLGDVVVRTALYVDPETAQIKAVSDPIPHILQGIPLDVRSVTLKVDRPNFMLNPTNCEPLAFSGSETSVLESAAPLSQRFQVGGCSALPFNPKLSISLKGSTKRTGHPALKAVLTMKPGQANIAKAQVTLPHSEFLDQNHIGTVCTRVQFAEGSVPGERCPAASVYGHARAVTPLLDAPVEGSVYLMSGFGHKLPDLAAALNGQIDVLLHGKVDTGRSGGIRNTFEVVPDAPVSKFTLEMQGGRKGLLVNSESLCGEKPHRAIADFTGQNGKLSDTEPVVKAKCPKARRGHGRHKGHKRHRRR